MDQVRSAPDDVAGAGRLVDCPVGCCTGNASGPTSSAPSSGMDGGRVGPAPAGTGRSSASPCATAWALPAGPAARRRDVGGVPPRTGPLAPPGSGRGWRDLGQAGTAAVHPAGHAAQEFVHELTALQDDAAPVPCDAVDALLDTPRRTPLRPPFSRPATQTLAVSRRKSHSHAPGCALSKLLRSNTRSHS